MDKKSADSERLQISDEDAAKNLQIPCGLLADRPEEKFAYSGPVICRFAAGNLQIPDSE